MLSNIHSMALIGIEGYLVNVEVDITSGMPSWEIVGLPDTSVRESKERVRTAIKNSGFQFLNRKITINLAPASIKKEGSLFDLAIAIGILNSMGYIISKNLEEYMFIGELSLNGNINKVNGIIAMCMEARNLGIKKIIIPYDNKLEGGIVNEIEVIPAKTLLDVVKHINGVKKIRSFKSDIKYVLDNSVKNEDIDFSEVKGHENVKRALEIAAAGSHNCILIGSPGTGKTMLAKRFSTILPNLTFEESIEITKIYSVAGLLQQDKPLIIERPFRSPHQSASKISLTGGGRVPKPGEMSLSHYGVLFLDEIPEFSRDTLESMREPLEDRTITISRMNCTVTYPCNFILIASMNPCPCGYANDLKKRCRCSEIEISRYMKKISGPLMDRIDIQVEVPSMPYKKLENIKKGETSAQIRERVNKARRKQLKRYQKYKIYSNADMPNTLIEKFCKIGNESRKLLEKAFEQFGFTARTYSKILRVARTIADLEGTEEILPNHIAEAIQYRILDRRI